MITSNSPYPPAASRSSSVSSPPTDFVVTVMPVRIWKSDSACVGSSERRPTRVMVFSGVWSEPWKMSAGNVSALEPPRPMHPAPASSAAAEARKSRRVRTTALWQAAWLRRFGHQAQLPGSGLRVFEGAAALTADQRVWHRHRGRGIDQPAHGATADRADRRTGGTGCTRQHRPHRPQDLHLVRIHRLHIVVLRL